MSAAFLEGFLRGREAMAIPDVYVSEGINRAMCTELERRVLRSRGLPGRAEIARAMNQFGWRVLFHEARSRDLGQSTHWMAFVPHDEVQGQSLAFQVDVFWRALDAVMVSADGNTLLGVAVADIPAGGRGLVQTSGTIQVRTGDLATRPDYRHQRYAPVPIPVFNDDEPKVATPVAPPRRRRITLPKESS